MLSYWDEKMDKSGQNKDGNTLKSKDTENYPILKTLTHTHHG